MDGYKLLNLGAFGEDDLDGYAVAAADSFQDLISFVGQTAGVEGEHAHGGRDARGHIDNDHALLLEAGGDGEGIAESVDGPGKNFGSGGALEVSGTEQSLSSLTGLTGFRCVAILFELHWEPTEQ